MSEISELFENNKAWVESILENDPDYFANLAKGQSPKYLWIGCSDARVPANTLTGLAPGEVFVHRNIANVVVNTDINLLSVMQYAVEVLKVEHIIVCGHYGCGGVEASMKQQELGLIDNWLRNIREVYQRHYEEVQALADHEKRFDRLCELNVLAQVTNVCHTQIVQSAWKQQQPLSVHGLIYCLSEGLIKPLVGPLSSLDQIHPAFRV